MEKEDDAILIALGTFSKDLEGGLKSMKSEDQLRPSQLQLFWGRTEYWEESWRHEENWCHLDPSESPSANAGV